MLKKTITYEDLDGKPLTEDFYFHMSQADLTRMNLSADGGLEEMLKRLIRANKGGEIVEQFEKIILGSYGVRSDDNRKFRKSPEISQDFKDTDAYSVLFMELVADDVKAAEFMKGILPSNVINQIDGPQDKPTPQNREPGNVFANNPSTPTTQLGYSAVDLLAMTPEQFAQVRAGQNPQ